MSDQDDVLLYNDDDSLEFIKKQLPAEMKQKFSDDDINYIVDLIYDYYESKGYFDNDLDDEAEIEIDEDELIAYVIKNAKKDGVGTFTEEEVSAIVEGELAYCDSIDLFD
ncbi:MAG: hypothetical protein PUB21_08620 [Bacteroidales bacterium]|nr:hypothetical protein [Bacteroidales bacterium]